MIILDSHLPPSMAPWIIETYNIDCFSATYLNLRHAADLDLFQFARTNNAIFITKDDDFLELNSRFGSPPKIIWLTCGNTSKKRLKEIFISYFHQAIELLNSSDIVEISGI
jgi:predicted nuclease of predicted toxin-antitoxin system